MIFSKRGIPWLIAAGRALLGPVMVLGALGGWSGVAMASIAVTAQVSDIVDGKLARRWGCESASGALFDSMADTVFYLNAAVALWIGQPQLWRRDAWLLAALLSLEGIRFAFDFWKYGKPASYHSYLAKAWGIVMVVAVAAVFLSSRAGWMMATALTLGIVCDVEGLAMSLVLPVWKVDIKTLRTALQVRDEILMSARRLGD